MKETRLNNIIRNILRESIPGNPKKYSTSVGLYGNVQPAYNYKSRGPVPGRMYSPGFNYESQGPLGVSYFMEDDDEGPNPWAICTTSLGLEGKKRKDYTQSEKTKYEKCVLGMKKEIKESHMDRIVEKTLNKRKTLNESWMAFLHKNHVEAACDECEAKGCECSASRYKRDRWGAWTLQVNCYGRKCGYYDNKSTGSPTDDTELKSRNIDITGDRLTKTTINESQHGSSYMAKKQLWGIAEKAKDMAERLPDNTQLEDWMESHIAKADSMMDSVYDSFDYANQMEIPGFEGTMDALDDLTIREQETEYRDQETGKRVESSVQLDMMTDYLIDIHTMVENMEENLSRRWS